MIAPYSRPQDVLFSADDGPQIAGPYTDKFPVGRKSRKMSAGWVLFWLALASLAAGALLASLTDLANRMQL